MTGKTEATASCTATSARSHELAEWARRRSNAVGTPVVLADGDHWLLANPTYSPSTTGLTSPVLDSQLDRIFESSILSETLELVDVWDAARRLLLQNYVLSDDELSVLLSVAPGSESRALANGVLDALFGADRSEKGFTAWVRASLLANGLGGQEIPAADIFNVLSILVATHRSVPLAQFADACRLQQECLNLESLI